MLDWGAAAGTGYLLRRRGFETVAWFPTRTIYRNRGLLAREQGLDVIVTGDGMLPSRRRRSTPSCHAASSSIVDERVRCGDRPRAEAGGYFSSISSRTSSARSVARRKLVGVAAALPAARSATSCAAGSRSGGTSRLAVGNPAGSRCRRLFDAHPRSCCRSMARCCAMPV
jgi:hypothetical protein